MIEIFFFSFLVCVVAMLYTCIQITLLIMGATTDKKQTAFRLSTDWLARLKVEAKKRT